MVNNCYIECQVCHSITRVRLQVGYLEGHPIVVTCGKCGVSLNGNIKIDQESQTLIFQFDNADIVNEHRKEDFTVECSGEFPVRKQQENCVENIDIITPFLRNQMRMGTDEYERFHKTILTLNWSQKHWKDFKRVIDLFKGGNKQYLLPEIWKLLPKSMFPCRNEFEIFRAIHILEMQYFVKALREEILTNVSFSDYILRLDRDQMVGLVNFLNDHEGYSLSEMQNSIYKIYEEFQKVYQSLIPAISLQFMDQDEVDFEEEGSTTSTFEGVKQFSLDVYETLGNLLVIPVALNNLKYRGSYKKCEELEKNNIDFEEFIKKPKGTRFHYCNDNEIFTKELAITINSKLRNAIGHNDIDYDPVMQKITYVPNPRDRSKKETAYLLEFESEAVHLFQAVLVVSEYLYRLRELELIMNGHVPLLPLELDAKFKKVGRNEPCPCGSGLKYKRCHGR